LGIHNRAKKAEILGDWVATGQHGGAIYVRGDVDESKLGNGASQFRVTADDEITIKKVLKEYCQVFGLDLEGLLDAEFTKIAPLSHRPYAALYTCE
jgi:glutamate synthase domain-containing protein 3